jgi:thiol-disulfide isomerase/thioredoxin
MKKAGVLFAAFMLGTASVWAFEPPTDEAVANAVSSYNEKTKGLERTDSEGRRNAAKEALAGIPISELSFDQLQKLTMLIGLSGQRDAARERYEAISKEPTAAGARAALTLVSYIPATAMGKEGDELKAAREADARVRANAVLAAMKHPGFGEAVEAGSTEFLAALNPSTASGFAGHEKELLAIERHLTADLPASFLMRSTGIVEFFNAEGLSVDAADRERIRAKLSSLIAASINSEEDEKTVASLKRTQKFIDGAFARGQLMNHTAPEVEVLWTNAKEPIKSLADLRGKVVVVDFWATWCGPCIGSFPDVRELVKHYEGYPVAVIGVTSPQGYHIDHKVEDPAQRRIDTKGDEAKEFALMEKFVKDMEVTWPVVFTRNEVFNPDYGVRGIPHVAIIDAKGVVRHNGLHPNHKVLAAEKKYAMIDALLKEAGLPAPAPEAAAPAEAKQSESH